MSAPAAPLVVGAIVEFEQVGLVPHHPHEIPRRAEKHQPIALARVIHTLSTKRSGETLQVTTVCAHSLFGKPTVDGYSFEKFYQKNLCEFSGHFKFFPFRFSPDGRQLETK